MPAPVEELRLVLLQTACSVGSINTEAQQDLHLDGTFRIAEWIDKVRLLLRWHDDLGRKRSGHRRSGAEHQVVLPVRRRWRRMQ
jgi:hypothetical protein